MAFSLPRLFQGVALVAVVGISAAASAQTPPPVGQAPARDRSKSIDMAPPPGPPPSSGVGGLLGGPPPPMPSVADTTYVSAIRVRDGAYSATGSTPAAVVGGASGDTFAKGIVIRSATPALNGVFVQGGPSAYTLSDATIDLSGMGKSDFLGIGAGAMTDGGLLVLKNVRITTAGAVSSATIATGNGVMRVYDSTLIAHGGALPPGYVPHIGPGMMEAPLPLKIKGTARTNITMGNSESYFYRSNIFADGWGALSTDATGGYVYLEANDCDIRVANSGYGAYADGGAHVVINTSKMTVATYGAIIAGSGEVRFSDVSGSSGGNAVMIHSVMGNPFEVGRLAITGGAMASAGPALLIKSANADITLDNAKLTPADGVLVRSIVNDDANRTAVNGAKTPGIKIGLRGGDYIGDIDHGDPERAMVVTLTGARLRGGVGGAELKLDGTSRWIATSNSTAILDGLVATSSLDAPAGVTINAKAGPGTTLRGIYSLASGGRLVVSR